MNGTIQLCDCSNVAVRFIGSEPVCERCMRLSNERKRLTIVQHVDRRDLPDIDVYPVAREVRGFL